MLKLCGFAVSNYYNKVKLALLEKGVPFEEVLVRTGKEESLLKHSPLGKIPYIETERGSLCESQVIAEYIEAAYPSPALYPGDPFAAAKVREVLTYSELHLELVARRLYAQAFFGGTVSDEVKADVEKLLKKGVAGFSRLARFAPFVAGSEFTWADCAAIAHLPLVSMATKAIYGQDILADLPVKEYIKRMGERPHVQKVNADRKAYLESTAKK